MTNRIGEQKVIAGLLANHEDALLQRWIELVAPTVRGRITEQELGRELRDLYAALVRALSGADDEAEGELRAVLTELSVSRARQGFTPSETSASIFAIKQAVHELIESADDAAAAAGTDARQALAEFIGFSRVIDDLGLLTFETYVSTRERVITDQAEELLELSTPVVKLWEGIVAVPLVGTLDSARTQVVMEKLLQTLVDTGSQHAVIDITGVPAVDTEVAQHLLKTIVAARLMGAQCTISGIRPQIAHTIVTLGIEFGDIVTKATLADALLYALDQLGVRVSSGGERTVR